MLRQWQETIIVTFFAIFLVFPAFAGGQQEDTEDAPDEETMTIYWNPDHLYDVYEEIIDEFAEEKGLNVNMEVFHWDDFRTQLAADFSAGTVPDLIEVPAPWIAEFGSQGRLADLTDQIEGWPDHEDWLESTWEETGVDGTLYGLKLHHTAFGIFYNQSHFEQAGISEEPSTLGELEEAIDRIDSELGPDVIPFGFDPTGQYLVPFLVNTDTPYLIEDGEIAIDTPDHRETLHRLQALAQSGKVLVPDPGGEEARANVRQLFFGEGVSMMISGPWEVGNIRENFPNLEYGVMSIPHVEGVDGGTLTAGVGLASPAGGDIEDDVVFELMQRLTELETEVAATQEAGMLMPRKSWADHPDVQDDRTVQLFSDILPNARPFDIHARTMGLPEITWGGPVFNRLYESLIYGDRDMDDALDTYIDEANSLIQEQMD